MTELICPCCKGKGTIEPERKEYTSECPKARRHLYTDKTGERIDFCVHCGKKK